jgi:hypothetical protein
MLESNHSIACLDEIVSSLSAGDRELFDRIYAVTVTVGEQVFPKGMEPWIIKQFGSVEQVARQKIVRVTNKITNEEAIFNKARASRPIEVKDRSSIDALLDEPYQKDPFYYPEETTPQDSFSRVVGKHCITASNIAKFDGLHGLVIFNEFNPLSFSREQVVDYLDVALEWAKRAHTLEPEARYFCLIWNCLWRAAASIVHGHMQTMLTKGRHYAKIDWLRRAALDYRRHYQSSYFADLFQLHYALGCAMGKDGTKIIASLTPFKDNEVMIIAGEMNLDFKEKMYEVLACFRDKLGITSVNLSLVTPPLVETEESWEDFPVIVRLVDRGDLHNRSSDIGGLEIYASSVVATDPFELTRQAKQYLEWQEVLDG